MIVAHNSGLSGDFSSPCDKYGTHIVGSKGSKLAKHAYKLWNQFLQVDFGVDLDFRRPEVVGEKFFGHFVKSSLELLEFVKTDRQARRILVSAELYQLVLASF